MLLLPEVLKLTRPLLVVPATNVINECLFFSMKRIRPYLKSTRIR